MKLCIAGTRTLNPKFTFIQGAIRLFDDIQNIEEIVSGCADGVDTSGEIFAEEWLLPIKRFLPDWETFGKAAGPKRNKEMAKYSDALLLIWNGESVGSKHCKSEFEKLNKPIYEVILRKI